MSDDSDSSNYSNEGRNSTPPAYSGSEYSGLGSGYSSMGGTYGTEQGGRIPGSSGSWGYGANGRVYGNIQDAAESRGVEPSSLTPKLPSWSKYVPGGSLANGLAGLVGMMQDAGLPGYAKTDAEWNAQTNPTGTHSGSGEYGHTGDYSSALLASMGAGGGQGGSIADLAAGAMNLGSVGSTLPTDPEQLASAIARDSYSQWIDRDRPRLQGQADQAETRGNRAYDTAMSTSDENLGLARQMNADYSNIYRPFQRQQADDVRRLGSSDYAAQQRGMATAGAQHTMDAQYGALERQNMARGIAPGRGDFARSRAMDTARLKVMAASAADSRTRGEATAGVNGMVNNGLALQKQATGVQDAGMNWSKFGLSAGASGLGAGMDMSKLNAGNAQASGQIASSAANAKYAGMNANTNAKAQASKDDPWTTIGGAFLSAGAKSLGGSLFGRSPVGESLFG